MASYRQFGEVVDQLTDIATLVAARDVNMHVKPILQCQHDPAMDQRIPARHLRCPGRAGDAPSAARAGLFGDNIGDERSIASYWISNMRRFIHGSGLTIHDQDTRGKILAVSMASRWRRTNSIIAASRSSLR